MESIAVASERPQESSSSANVGEDVRQCVETHVRRENMARRIVFTVVFGVPVLISFLKDGLGFEFITTAILTFFGSKVALFLVRKVYLEPSRDRAFERAAERLKGLIGTNYGPGVQTFSWSHPAPGALGLTSAGQVVVSAASTDYRAVAISPSQIADVRVERRAEVVTQTKHSGSTGVGFLGKSFAVGQSLGGRSTSVSQTIEYYALELRYQLEKNGKIHSVVVPGGSSRTTVEEICTAIRRLEA